MNPILIWSDYALDAIAARGITEAEVEEVFADPHAEQDTSRSSNRPIVKGVTRAGRYLVVVYEEADDNPLRLEVINAFAPGET